MSILNTIVDELFRKEFNYKGVKVNIFGIPALFNKNKSSINTCIQRAKKMGYFDGAKNEYYLTEKGRIYAKQIKNRLIVFEQPRVVSKNKDLLLMFDIPEDRKAERDWLRFHLRLFGFEMMQRSIWIGPSDFPSDFRKYLKERKLNKYIMVFKLAKGFTDKNIHFLR